MTYYSGVLYELYRIQRQWWIDASVSKRMGNLRATLSARDPFNTNIARGSYNPEVNGLAFERNWHSPRLELTISYSWGKKSVKAQDTRVRYDDLKRLTTGASEGMNTPAQ